MFRTVLAADIGSMNMRFAVRGGVRSEACCLAIEKGEELHVTAIGDEAAVKRGAGIIHPMRDGAVASVRMLAIILKRAACELTGKRNPSYIELHMAAPRVLGSIKQNSLKQAAKLAGFKDVRFHDALLMGAIGAGMDIFGDRASMLVNIGADTISCAAAANGGMLFESFELGGSRTVDGAIRQYFMAEHDILIGERTAETIKWNLDRSSFCVDGRSCRSGFPQTATADGKRLRRAVEASSAVLARTVADAIKGLQIEAAADLLDTGITLIGGGARQYGLAGLFEDILGVPVRTAENAGTAVADGMKDYIMDRPGYYDEARQGCTSSEMMA